MDCRIKLSNEIRHNIYEIIGIGRTSAIPNKPNSILLPIGGKDNENKSLKTKNNTYYWAQRIQEAVNSKYNSEQFGNLITIDNDSSDKGTIVNITIPTKLIDAYEVKNGQKEYEDFLKEHEVRMAEGNQRITDEGDVLYGMEAEAERSKEDVQFHINTITAVTGFLDKIGVPIELSTFDREEILAAANFMKMSVQVAEDMEKRPSAWNKLPEEAAHFWYRLLDTNSPLKDALLQSAKTTHKEQDLRNTLYGKVYGEVPLAAEGKYELSPIREEAIGQLIAEAIKRIEQKNGSKADYSFFQAFLEWINSILKAFRLTQDDPFEVAAIKILAHDTSDLLTTREYKELNKQIYFGEDITDESLEKKEVIKQVIDPTEQFFNYLINGQFKKKTKYLQKTLDKYYKIVDVVDFAKHSSYKPTVKKLEFIKPLQKYEKDTLISTNNYTNITPALKGLSTILTKYKKQPVSLNQEFKLDGVKKAELEVYNSVLNIIKFENPTLKSISGEDFVNEIYNFLKTNYLLGFGNEKSYLDYRIDSTFNKPTQHRKISLRFNDSYYTKRSHFSMGPSAWGNLTPFAIEKRMIGPKLGEGEIDEEGWEIQNHKVEVIAGAVLLHEIQNDNIESLREINDKPNKISQVLDPFGDPFETLEANDLDSYLGNLYNTTQTNLNALEKGSKTIKIIKSIYDTSKDNFVSRIFRSYLDTVPYPPSMLFDNIYQEAQHRKDLFNITHSNGSNAKEYTFKRLETLYSRKGKLKHIEKTGGLKQFFSIDEQKNLENRLKNSYSILDFSDSLIVKKYTTNLLETLHAVYGDKDIPDIRLVTTKNKRYRINTPNSFPVSVNTNVMFRYSLQKAFADINKEIILTKKAYIDAVKREKAYLFAEKVEKLSREQLSTLFENFKYNLELLDKLIKEKSSKDLSKFTTTENNEEEVKRLIELHEYLEKEALLTASNIDEEVNKEKKEAQKILDRELNYFTPLVHHLIQTHIKDYGKGTPLYFSGHEITMLTQGNSSTAAIYAGPEEVKKGIASKVGPLWTAMNNIAGIKLEYFEFIPGFVKAVGGYKVDLSNYSYQTPILYGLDTNKPSKTVGKKNEKLDLLLKEYLTINGIHLEYLTTLLDKFGGDYTAAYHRGIKEVISINSRRERKDTLAEEVAHSLVEGLGEDDFLVNKALNLIGKTDYKSTLDPQYIKLYKNNEKALKKEYLGKLIAEVLVHKFEPTTPTELTLLQTILKLIDKFLSMFKPNDRVEQIEAIAGQLANKIINKEKIVPFGTTTPDNTTWFQVDEKKPINEEYKRQYVYFKRRIGQINTALDDDRVSPERKIELKAEQEKIKRVLDELRETDNIQLLIDLGEEVLNKLDVDFIRELENNTISVTTIKPNDLIYAIEALKALDALTGTSDRSKALYKRLVPFIKEFIFNQINKYATEEQGVSKEAIEAQITDINRAVMSFGALVDSDNYIARTVGAMVKEAQNTVSTENKHIANEIKEQVDKLREFSASRGISEKEMYKPFIQEYRGTTILTMPYTTEFYDLLHKSFKEENKVWRKANAIYNKTTETWSPKSTKFDNPNYKEIFKKGNEPMAEFYNFHKETIKNAAKKLPRKIGENFIANLARNTFVDILKGDGSINDKLKDAIQNITEIDSNVFDNTTLVGDEDLMLDKIPLKFLGAIPVKDKSNDLGENLLTFASFATSYKEMSEVLPKARLFQEQLKTKSFIKSSDPETRIEGEESNIFKMVKTYINMQVKGEDKNKEFKVSYKDIYDEDGNKIGEKYVHMSDFIDFGLRYNSLLRIGLNPFNAVTNVFVGDIGNIIEGFGARFYTLKDLKSATNIFFSQINKEESELNKWLEKLNPLQELEDYENVDKVALKKGVTPEKVKDKMYSLQRMGETFLQTRTMTAILIKDGYLTPEGITTEKGAELTKEQLTKLSNKVQRVNQMIHGRYSQRDAAIVQQSVLWRMALQFKKWIPAAIESRVQSKKYDNRLGTDVEGRYRTYAKWFKLMYAQLKSDKAGLEKNQFTELDKYNMRKNLAEITIALATLLMYTALGWDDDKKKKQNPYYKFTMNQLNRISGDILFFYSPTDMNRIIDRPFALVKTTGDLLDVIGTLPYAFGIEGSEYKRGIHKGENKFIASLIDVTPTAKPVADIFRLTKKVAYEEPNK